MKKILIFLLILCYHCCLAQKNTKDSLWQSYNNPAVSDTNRLNAIHKIAVSYINDNPDSAMVFIQKELDLALKAKQKKWEGKAYNAFGVAFLNKEDYSRAFEHFTKALKIREQINDRAGVNQTRFNIAHLFEVEGNPYKALEFWSSELNKLRHTADRQNKPDKEIAACLIQIGLVYSGQGEQVQALENFQEALSLMSSLKDTADKIEVIHNLGRLYNEMHEVDKSLENFTTVLSYYRSKNDAHAVRNVYNQIGHMYEFNSLPANALAYYKMSLKVSDSMLSARNIDESEKRVQSSWVRGTAGNIARVYLKTGDVDQALVYAHRSLKAAEDTKNTLQPSWAYLVFAEIYEKQKEYKKAKLYADKALAILKKEPGFVSNVRDLELFESKIDSALGDSKGALEHYKQYVLLRDKLTSVEVKKAATRDKYQSENEKQKALEKVEQDKKDKLRLEEKRRQALIIWSVSAGLLFVLIFTVYILYSLRVTKRQKHTIEIQKAEVERSRHIIEEKNKDITDSITYARRIQEAKLPKKETVYSALPHSFILFKPKDIVSGDFYFFHKNEGTCVIASADCTGHGVPGALMSMVGMEQLHNATLSGGDTSEILNILNKGIKSSLRQSGEDATRDGMDIALCSIDTKRRHLWYAGANRPLWIVRKGESQVEEIKATKKAIAGFTEEDQHFESHKIQLREGDTFYIFTDGYADTFGGEHDKKLTTQKFKQILVSIQNKSMLEQAQHLDNFIESWKGLTEQVDDILVIGVRV